MAPRRRKARRAKAASGMPFTMEDVSTARVKAGQGLSWNVPGGLPTNRVYRPVRVEAQVVSSGPSLVQLSIHDPSGNAVAYIAPRVVGTVPVNIKVLYPSSSPNFPPNTSSSASILLASLENVCQDADATLQHSILVSLRVVLRFGHEQVSKACPKGFGLGVWQGDEDMDPSSS